VRPAVPPGGRIQRLLAMGQHQLGMDVSYVARFQGGRQVYRAVQGDAASFGLQVGTGPQLEDTYCQRMVQGRLPNAVPDSALDARVRDLPATLATGIGAYVAVPLHLASGELYGTLCCLSHTARPDLDDRDVAVLTMLSELLADELEDDATRQRDLIEVERLMQDLAVTVALQPIVELATGACTGLEALARFDGHTPDQMFARADNAGLRTELETLCLEQALLRLPELRPHQRLAVNVSPEVACSVALQHPSTLPLDRLILEITEHTAVASYENLRQVIEPLRRRGLQLAVDDAGAGFASLRHILELGPDIIKVDRSLVAGLDTDAARRTIVTTFVLLALDLGASVIAEGVEREPELHALADLGVDAVQGFLLARPSTTAADISAWAGDQQALPWRDEWSGRLGRPLTPAGR
jgi:EAL domain-containing protein (putative c-di-GMP-specific phosphodiesterase class I)